MSASVVSDEPRASSPPSAPKSVRKEGGFEQKISRLPLNPTPTNKSAAPDLNRQLPPNSLSVIAAKRAQLADLAYPSPKRMLSLPDTSFFSPRNPSSAPAQNVCACQRYHPRRELEQSVICSGIDRLPPAKPLFHFLQDALLLRCAIAHRFIRIASETPLARHPFTAQTFTSPHKPSFAYLPVSVFFTS